MPDASGILKPSPNFRPNPSRAVYILGSIDAALVNQITPKIIDIQHQGRQPITVYIDSRGGFIASGESLRRLLWASGQDGEPPCRIITVVTIRAASAAADLLSSGDYAIAHAESMILYHGVRQSIEDPVTAEQASSLSEYLKIGNDRYAMALASRSNWRFVFRYMSLKSEFDEYRIKISRPDLTDMGCFLGIISEKLSLTALNVLDMAKTRNARYEALFTRVMKLMARSRKPGPAHLAYVERIILRGIIDFEVASNSKNPSWSFRDGDLTQLNDDFLLFREFLTSYEHEQLKKLCDRWGDFFLTKDDIEELEQTPADQRDKKKIEKLKPLIRPIWLLFVALCHALQEQDNELTATDAFWLGLIDEVIGQQDLPTLRIMVEFQNPSVQENLRLPFPNPTA